MSTKTLETTIARLETKIDLMETEFAYLNTILIRLGFSDGIRTLKTTVEDILTEEGNLSSDNSSDIL